MSRTRKTLELLAAERPPQLDLVDEARRERDLAGILAVPATGRDRGTRRGGAGRGQGASRSRDRDAAGLLPRRRRPVLRAGIATVLVAAVAVAVVAPHVRPDRARGRTAQASHGPQPTVTPKAQAGRPGHDFLLASAKRVLRIKATPEGPYWYMRIRNLVITGADAFSRHPRGLKFQVRIESTAESWMPRHHGTGHIVDPASLDDIKIGFPTAKDKAAWRAAGSPRIDYPAAGVGRGEDVPGTVLQVDVPGAEPLSVDAFLRLPTDPARLEAKIRALLHEALDYRKLSRSDAGGGVTIRTHKVPVTDWMVFQTVAGWLSTAPVTRAQQAALYAVIAGLPGVRYDGPATDHAGRRGIAISMIQPASAPSLGDWGMGGLNLVKDRFIINPATGELLASQQVVVKPGPPTGDVPSYPAGTVIVGQAFLARHWTDGPGPNGWPRNPPGVIAPKG